MGYAPTVKSVLAGTPSPSNQTLRPRDQTSPPPAIKIRGRKDRENVSERRQAGYVKSEWGTNCSPTVNSISAGTPSPSNQTLRPRDQTSFVLTALQIFLCDVNALSAVAACCGCLWLLQVVMQMGLAEMSAELSHGSASL